MTVTLTRPRDTPPADEAKPVKLRPARPEVPPLLRIITGVFSLLCVLLIGFVAFLFGLSRLSEAHAQNAMLKSFKYSLGQALAPVGPTTVGAPVAVLSIPSIGVKNLVVVEGTDARRLARGAGHRRDTVLPGQAGSSVIYGRRATFGAPFAKLLALKVGDKITVTTGQATNVYVVSSFGSGAHPAPANSTNRLVLTTADSAFIPHSTVSVSADLTTAVQPSPGGLSARYQDEKAMAGAMDQSVLPLMLWAQLLLLVAIVGTIAAHRWSRWPAFLCLTPVVLAVLWNLYENTATLLPNVY